MQNVQEIFNHIQELKKKTKEIRTSYKDALSGSQEYQEIEEKIKALRMRKKQIEASTKQDYSSEFDKIDEYKTDLASDNVLLSDAALTKMMKGETIEVVDEYNNNYEPVFTVKFKKT